MPILCLLFHLQMSNPFASWCQSAFLLNLFSTHALRRPALLGSGHQSYQALDITHEAAGQAVGAI